MINNYDSFTFNLIQLVEEGGYSYDVMNNDRIHFNILHRFEKILISPGPGVPNNAGQVLELIRAFSGRKSILGICLGHQAIAEAYGGRLFQMPSPLHGVQGRIRIVESSHYLFAGLPEEIDGGLYHSWAVSRDELPRCLKVIALGTNGTVMAISHYEDDVHGIQFHPESVMTPLGSTIMRNWLDHDSSRKRSVPRNGSTP